MQSGIKKNHVMVALTAFAAVALIVTGCSGLPVASPAEETRTVSVSGLGEKSSAPDIAYIDLGFEARDGDLDAALTESNQTIDAIMAALVGMGIEEKDLQTRDFNVWLDERYDNDGNPTGVSIYYVNNTVHVIVRDISTIGDVIAAGLDAGANRVLGLSFGIDEADALKAEARQMAIEDARVQAEQLASGLGMRLGDPIAISEGVVSSPVARGGVVMDAVGMGGGSAVPVSEGELTVTSQVTIVYELLP